MNHLKDVLRGARGELLALGPAAIGATVGLQSDVRLLANSGLDFVLFDTQHSPFEIKELAPAIAQTHGTGASPIVRVGDNRPELICYALDAGAKGIIVPMVNSADEAERMIRACKYHPDGVRSNAGRRGDWGEFDSYREYMDTVNQELVIIPMIETTEALEHIDEILEVPGIDVLLVGPSDLSIALDVPLDYENPKYIDSLDIIVSACRRHSVTPGMYFIPEQMEPSFFIEKGFGFCTVSWTEWATQGIQRGLEPLRGLYPAIQ